MANHTPAPSAPLLMLPVTVFFSALQEFARSLHQLQTYTGSLQQENQQLRHEKERLLKEVENLRESEIRQGLEIERLNAMLSGSHTPTNRSFGAHFQPSAPCDSGPNYAPGPTSLSVAHVHTGPEALQEIFGGQCSMRKRLKRKAEDELVADVEEYPFDEIKQV